MPGVIKEFPDLAGLPHPEAKKIALQRLKDHIKSLNNLPNR
jgi:hypothetical protein